jgi:hypothetical protein
MQSRFRKISETFENDAVLELPRVPDQQIAIGLSLEIRAEGIGYVVYATAQLGCGDHIDQRARGVRYMYFDRTGPQRFQPEEAFLLHAVQDDNCALGDHALLFDSPRCKD